MKSLVVLLLIAVTNTGFATSCSYTPDSFSKWMMEYFQSPDVKVLPCSLSYYANSTIFEEYPDSRMPTANFFASAYLESEYISLFANLQKRSSVNEKMFALHVFWVRNSINTRKLISQAGNVWNEPEIKEMVPKMLAAHPKNILIEKPRSAGELDNLWAIFFATGQAKPIEQIASILHLVKEGHGIEIAVAGSAHWSMTSNAKQFPEVRAIIQRLEQKATGEQKKMLKEILAKSANVNT